MPFQRAVSPCVHRSSFLHTLFGSCFCPLSFPRLCRHASIRTLVAETLYPRIGISVAILLVAGAFCAILIYSGLSPPVDAVLLKGGVRLLI
jgi:hypothetical protein